MAYSYSLLLSKQISFFVLLQLVTQVMSCYRLFLYSDRRLATLSICMHFCNTLSNFKLLKWPVTNVLDPFYIRCIQDILFVAVHFLLFRTIDVMPQQDDCYSDDIHPSFFVSLLFALEVNMVSSRFHYNQYKKPEVAYGGLYILADGDSVLFCYRRWVSESH